MKRSELIRVGCGMALAALLAWGPGGVRAAAPQTAPAGDESKAEAAPVKNIKMYAENWKFIPKVIRVKQGTKVHIDFVSRDASHSFVLKAYGLKVALPEGSELEVEFVADKVGTFRWRCGRPCGDGCAKMTGKLIVEE